MPEIPDEEFSPYLRNMPEKLNRANQFLHEYTQEADGNVITYLTIKRHYYSFCRLLGLAETEYGWVEIFRALDQKSLLHYVPDERALVVGLKMKHPLRLPKYYKSQDRKGITADVKREVFRKLQEIGNICGICGQVISETDKVHIDHIKPVVLGGTDELSNLRAVHQRCNLTRIYWKE